MTAASPCSKAIWMSSLVGMRKFMGRIINRTATVGQLFWDLSSYDWQNHRLMIYGKGGIYGTQSKRRIIPLTDRIRPLIDGHFAIHDTIGMTPRTMQRIRKRLANKARINRPVTPHVLRHTFAVAAVQKGISLPALQRLLGHDRLTTTEIYLNLSPEDVIREFKEKW